MRYIFFYRKKLIPFGFDELEVHSLNHRFDCYLLIGCIVGKMSMFFSLEFTAEHEEDSITLSMYELNYYHMGLKAVCNCTELITLSIII